MAQLLHAEVSGGQSSVGGAHELKKKDSGDEEARKAGRSPHFSYGAKERRLSHQ